MSRSVWRPVRWTRLFFSRTILVRKTNKKITVSTPKQSWTPQCPLSARVELTQVEVRGLRQNGEGRGLGEHLTTNCGCRTIRASVHFLKCLPVAVHVSLQAETTRPTKTLTCAEEWVRSGDQRFFFFFFPSYLFWTSSRIHCDGVCELWRNTPDGGTDRRIRRRAVIQITLILTVAGDTTARQSAGLVWGLSLSLKTWDQITQVNSHQTFLIKITSSPG